MLKVWVVLAVQSVALAAWATPVVVVLPFSGHETAEIEQAAVESLGGHASFAVISSWDAAKRLQAAGIDARDPHRVALAAQLFHAGMLLEGEITPKQMNFVLWGGDGSVLGRAVYPRKYPITKLEDNLYDRLHKAIALGVRITPPAPLNAAATPAPSTPAPAPAPTAPVAAAAPTTSPAPAPAPASVPATVAATPTPPPAASPAPASNEVHAARPADEGESDAPPLVDASVGGGTLTRSLRYKQDLFGKLGGYTLDGGPLVSVRLSTYPLQLATQGLMRNLGLFGEFDHSVGLSSQLDSGQSFTTTAFRWDVGLRARFPLDAFELGVTAAYGQQAFDLGGVSAVQPIPDYGYTFIRAAVDARYQVSQPIAVMASAGYVAVTDVSAGGPDFFPHASAGGLEVSAGVAARLTRWFELRLTGDFERLGLAFNPVPGDVNVAGGALDQYLTVNLAAAFALR